jgi:signal transduction histidine kinase
MQERVFERFHRGSNHESAAPGWGLGLYFARKLAEAQGGQIMLHSPVHADAAAPGATFSISLPIADSPDDTNDV